MSFSLDKRRPFAAVAGSALGLITLLFINSAPSEMSFIVNGGAAAAAI